MDAPASYESSDMDAVRAAHRFIWDDDAKRSRQTRWGEAADGSGGAAALGWEERLAKRYYDQLFREYALADMTRYKEGAIGLRWRTEQEVFDGKGQFVCGNKRCSADQGLQSFELHFAYVEHGEQRQALVKLRVCPGCSEMLHYRQLKEARREARREKKRAARREEKKKRSGKKHRHHRKGRSHSRSPSPSSGSGSDDSGRGGAAARGRSGASGGGAAAAEDTAVDEEAAAAAARAAASEVWRAKPTQEETRTDAEEFDDYFRDICSDMLI